MILDKLASAFRGGQVVERSDNEFLSFIGYPPVLDAIATLLENRKNFHSIIEELAATASSKMEISLLCEISAHILNRERVEKVVPIVTKQVLAELSQSEQDNLARKIYTIEEQCVRLVEYSLGLGSDHPWISDPVLSDSYEKCLATFFYEHPFLTGTGPIFRNVIFEAMVVATLYCSQSERFQELADKYLRGRKSSYYLVYFMDILAKERRIPARAIGHLLNSALEFRSKGTSVYLSVDSDFDSPDSTEADVEVEIVSEEVDKSTRMLFSSLLSNDSVLQIENRLASTSISVPCEVFLIAPHEFEMTAPVDIRARRISFACSTVVLKTLPRTDEKKQQECEVFLGADEIRSELQHLIQNGVIFNIEVTNRGGIYHPLASYVTVCDVVPKAPVLQEKYLRLRKLLTHFRSHSRGRMAKFSGKVENERVAGNVVGGSILRRLMADGILYKEDKFYFIAPELLSDHLGVSWSDLRRGIASDRLLDYLRSI